MVITLMAAGVVSVLTPLLKKGAEAFTEAAGKEAAQKAMSLLAGLRQRWAGDAAAKAELAKFEADPPAHADGLKEVLTAAMTADPQFAAEIERVIKQIPPKIWVQQIFNEGKEVYGARIARDLQADVTIIQEANKVEKMTGLELT
jgi:Tfp pilus assembly protein PilN